MIIKLRTAVSRFSKEEAGAAMVEYAVALLVVTAIGIGTMTAIGQNASVMTDATCTGLNAGAAVAGTAVVCP